MAPDAKQRIGRIGRESPQPPRGPVGRATHRAVAADNQTEPTYAYPQGGRPRVRIAGSMARIVWTDATPSGVLLAHSEAERREREAVRIVPTTVHFLTFLFRTVISATGARRVRVERLMLGGTIDLPKSHYSIRTVPLSRTMAADLSDHRAESLYPADGDLAFPTKTGTHIHSSNLSHRVIKPAAVAAGVPWASAHTLRHTCASRLFKAGWNAKQVQMMLGHHSPASRSRPTCNCSTSATTAPRSSGDSTDAPAARVCDAELRKACCRSPRRARSVDETRLAGFPGVVEATPLTDQSSKEETMALSDQLHRLADRADQAERQAAAAMDKAMADLEQDLKQSREDAQQDAEQLRQAAEAARGKISDSWNDIQKSWNEHSAQLQKSLETKIAEVDLARAQRHADNAEADALYAIDFAYSAIAEAEYAVINAQLARKTADELAAGTSARA